MTTHDRRRDILKNDPPRIVFVGDSHVGHLKTWHEFIMKDPVRFKLENVVLSKAQYVYSGGSRWDTIVNRVQGKKVPVHQRQGNTLKAVADNKLNKPELMFWMCGTNDCDMYNDRYHDALRRSPVWGMIVCNEYGPSKYYKEKNPHWNDQIILPPSSTPKYPQDVIDDLHADIKKHMDVTIKKITEVIPGCQQFAIEIVPRANWYPAVKQACYGVSAYMRSKHKMTVAKVKQHVKPWHMKRDQIHFSVSGYRMVMDKGVGPMLDVYYDQVRVPKQARMVEQKPLSRNGRKRAAKRAKLMQKDGQSGD